MGGVVSAVVGVVNDVVDTVGTVATDAVKVADGVVDSVVKPVAKAVDNTLQAAQNDPLGTLAKVTTMIVAPEFLPAVNAADALSRGASLDQVVKGTATSLITNEFTPNMASDVAQAADSQIIGNLAQSATKGAISAGLQGKDALTGATAATLSSGINQGISGLNSAVQQEDTAPKLPQSTETYTPAPDTSGGLPATTNTTDANQPFGYTYDAITGQTTPASNADEVMAANAGANPTAYTYNPATGALVPAYTQGELTAANAALPGCYSEPGTISAPCTTAARIAQKMLTPSLVASIMGSSNAARARTPAQRRAIQSAFGPGCSSLPWLDTTAQLLTGVMPGEEDTITGGLGGVKGAVPETKVPNLGAPDFTGLTPELVNAIRDRGINVHAATGGSIQNYACGSGVSYCGAMNAMNQFTPKFYAVKCGMLPSTAGKKSPLALAQIKQLQSHIAAGGNMGGMAKGGLPAKYQEAAPDGHHPEFITGLTGYYAGGRGTGQSDDIPAMLHDGDYVMDAEAVSAFGDGSSKAGNEVLMHFMHQIPHTKSVGEGKPVPAKIADGEVVLPESFVTALGGGDNKRGAKMLDEIRHRLREHKRSAPDTKIPPKAKSPLEYLKGAKG